MTMERNYLIIKKAGATSIHSINATNEISMNDDDNFMHKYYAPFLSSKNHADVSYGSEHVSSKRRFCCHKNIILDLLLNISKSFEWHISLLFFVLGDKTFLSHMTQISEHINSSNHKIHSYDKMIKIIVNLGNDKCENNNNSTCQLRSLQNSVLIVIVDTTEKYLLNVYQKPDTTKLSISSIKSSSTLFSCSICAMHNIVHFSKKTSHV